MELYKGIYGISHNDAITILIKKYYLELLRVSEGTLNRWSRMHLQSLAPTNPHWVCVFSYGPLF
jgi:hypothetical protein